MDQTSPKPARIRFGDFEADLHTEELRRHGRAVRLPNQSFLVLSMLLQNPGQLVTRDDMRKRLWPRDSFIEYDQALNAAVNRLRDALRDSADEPRYIETLPRRGYRFIGKIEPGMPEPAPAPAVSSPDSPAAEEPTTVPVGHRRPLAVLLLAIVVLLATVAIPIMRTGSRTSRAEPHLNPFTSLPNREISPTFAPDGNRIAFAWTGAADDSQGFDLYVKGVDVEKTLRLTQKPAQWLSPAWSHDGRQIAFARASAADSGIFLVPALGGEERRLTTASFAEGAPTQVTWSADDKVLVYSAFGSSGTQVLYRLPLDSLAPQPIPLSLSCWDITSPAFSPDGSLIAFICTTSVAVYSIHATHPDGSNLRKLADVKGYPGGLAWSADGSHVVFANDSGDGGGLWQVSLDGRISRVAFGEEASAPASAATGGRIAYVRGRSAVDIWRIDLQAPSPAQSAERLISSTRQQITPQYSPDGAYIAFQSNRSGSSEIWIAAADGSNPVRVSSFGGPLTGAPSWCADGKRLAFDSRASGVSALYVADIDERLPRIVQTSVANLALPVWSGDCQWLIASDGNEVSYLVPAAGGPARRFTARRSYYASVEGDRVVFNVKGTTSVVTLWQKRIDAGEEQPLTGMPDLSYADSWVANDHGVYFTLASDDGQLVRFYDLRTHVVSPVVRLSRPTTPAGGLGLSISRDNRYLLYTQTEDQQSDIMLISGL
ncbi:MAG TPA: LpqB family beta-propeller domain-containing protein [Povalibacter sp.]|nr:LpqB family beta-propeller domain-containing protein [Povalibacter sp.]